MVCGLPLPSWPRPFAHLRVLELDGAACAPMRAAAPSTSPAVEPLLALSMFHVKHRAGSVFPGCQAVRTSSRAGARPWGVASSSAPPPRRPCSLRSRPPKFHVKHRAGLRMRNRCSTRPTPVTDANRMAHALESSSWGRRIGALVDVARRRAETYGRSEYRAASHSADVLRAHLSSFAHCNRISDCTGARRVACVHGGSSGTSSRRLWSPRSRLSMFHVKHLAGWHAESDALRAPPFRNAGATRAPAPLPVAGRGAA
jgi:hypothetical protein